MKSSRRETILLYCHTMTNWTEQTVDVLKHHLLQTLHGCFLLRIKKDLSLFTLTADCSSDVTWSHGMCYLHFGNEVRNSRRNVADYCIRGLHIPWFLVHQMPSHCSRIDGYPNFIALDFFHFSWLIHNWDNQNM